MFINDKVDLYSQEDCSYQDQNSRTKSSQAMYVVVDENLSDRPFASDLP